MAFASKVVLALDSEAVQAKIFNSSVKPLFEQHNAAFGQAIGIKVGDMLVDLKRYFEQELLQLKTSLTNDIQKASYAHMEAKDVNVEKTEKVNVESVEQGVAAPSSSERAAASLRSTRTRKRRLRRKVCKAGHQIARELLLQHRNGQHPDNLEQKSSMPSLDVEQRLHNIEVIVTSAAYSSVELIGGGRPEWSADEAWTSLQSEFDGSIPVACALQGVPGAVLPPLRAGAPAFVPEVSADTLAQLCAAAQAIQRAWHCRCVRARARNALTGQGSCAAQRHTTKPLTPYGASQFIEEHGTAANSCSTLQPISARIGLRVRIHGLSSDAGRHLNGRTAAVVQAPEGSDRVRVEIDDTSEIKSIRLRNLKWNTFGPIDLDYGLLQKEYWGKVVQLVEQGHRQSDNTLLEVLFLEGGNVEQAAARLASESDGSTDHDIKVASIVQNEPNHTNITD